MKLPEEIKMGKKGIKRHDIFSFFLKGEKEMMELGCRGFSYIDIDLSVTENNE